MPALPQRRRRGTQLPPVAAAARADVTDEGGNEDDVPEPKPSLLRNPHDNEIWAIALPALGAVMLDPITSLVDTAMVGRLCGSTALAGVGLSGLMFSFMSYMFGFLATITVPRVATAMAQHRPQEASLHIARSMWIAAGAGILLLVLCLGAGDKLLSFLTSDPAVAASAYDYLKARAWSAPALLVQFVCLGSLRGLADTRTSLGAAVISNVANFLLDLWFMLGLGWGVVGAAAASSVSQWCGTVVLCYLLSRKGKC
jgi:multidrug resistance protein, MATE family